MACVVGVAGGEPGLGACLELGAWPEWGRGRVLLRLRDPSNMQHRSCLLAGTALCFLEDKIALESRSWKVCLSRTIPLPQARPGATVRGCRDGHGAVLAQLLRGWNEPPGAPYSEAPISVIPEPLSSLANGFTHVFLRENKRAWAVGSSFPTSRWVYATSRIIGLKNRRNRESLTPPSDMQPHLTGEFARTVQRSGSGVC